MDPQYRISEAADATGFTASALRFYEKAGVVVPGRTATGYRSYQEEDIEDLRFLARAKRLGLSLPEVTELLGLLREEDCRPVQARLHQLVTDRIDAAQEQIADLVAMAAQLQQAASRLGMHTPAGACDDRCGCRTDPAPTDEAPAPATGVPLMGAGTPEVACSLEPHRVEERTEAWKSTAASAEGHEPLPDGIRLRFPRNADVAGISQLAADEQTCCGFFTFNIGVHADSVTLDVTGPPTAQSVIAAMFGAAA